MNYDNNCCVSSIRTYKIVGNAHILVSICLVKFP